ncbi:MAG: protein kinase [Planctomycetota bacterium]
MSDTDPKERKRPTLDVPPSVLSVLTDRIGEAPRVSLREEPSAQGGAPVIDPRADERAALPEGRGSYQVLGEIARGGMGTVLRGHDNDLGRDVAMKVLNKDLADRPEVVQRFVEEAQIGGQLQHPGIVPVYELGLMADDRPYFTMKLVKGRTLATLLAERESSSADRSRLVDVFESTCQTVAYAHSRGVIHRDLKPANIMVGAFGEVQVVDWGLAKVLARGGNDDERRAREAQPEHTILETVRSDGSSTGSESLVGSVIGTPAYMPPEQARGDVERLDERADVFALGAILCEILTGAPPYVGERAEILMQAAQAELDDAYARLDASEADAALVDLAKRCLVAAPQARPRSASMVAEAVREYVGGVEERANEARVEAAEARVRVAEERKARRLTLMLAGSVLALISVGGGSWFWIDRARARDAAEASARERALEREVDGVLASARLLASREDWTAARAAIDGARALVAASGDVPRISEEITASEEELGTLQDAADERDERQRDTARLVEELELALRPFDLDPTLDPARREALTYGSYAGIFASHGIDIDGTSTDDLAEEFRGRGLGAEFALLLDGWVSVRRSQGDVDGARHLLAINSAIDPEPLRADLREAMANQDLDMLRTLAADGLYDQPPATLELLADSFIRIGDHSSALATAEYAVAQHPDNARLHNLLSNLIVGNGPRRLSTPEERRLGRRSLPHSWCAVALDPTNPRYRFYLATLLYRIDETAAGLRVAESAVSIGDAVGWSKMIFGGMLAFEDPENPRGREVLEDLMENASTPMLAYYATLIESGRREFLGDLEGALALAAQAARIEGADSDATRTLMQVHLKLGNLAGAERVFADDSLPPVRLNDMAWLLATVDLSTVDDPEVLASVADAAIEYGERAVAETPEVRTRWNTLGACLNRAGRYDEALAAYEESMAVYEGVGTWADWFGLAICHAELGDADTARIWFERARVYVDGTVDHEIGDGMEFVAKEAASRLGLPSPIPE